MSAPETYTPPAKTRYILTSPEDIPLGWPRLQARKNSAVTIRAANAVEESSVDWQDSVLTSDPQLDLIVKSLDGKEYPCKKDIFFSTYTGVPAENNEDMLAGYMFVKSALSTLVRIPAHATVEIQTLEGVLPVVEFPDYISIGPKGELYANTKDFVDQNMTFVS